MKRNEEILERSEGFSEPIRNIVNNALARAHTLETHTDWSTHDYHSDEPRHEHHSDKGKSDDE